MVCLLLVDAGQFIWLLQAVESADFAFLYILVSTTIAIAITITITVIDITIIVVVVSIVVFVCIAITLRFVVVVVIFNRIDIHAHIDNIRPELTGSLRDILLKLQLQLQQFNLRWQKTRNRSILILTQ